MKMAKGKYNSSMVIFAAFFWLAGWVVLFMFDWRIALGVFAMKFAENLFEQTKKPINSFF